MPDQLYLQLTPLSLVVACAAVLFGALELGLWLGARRLRRRGEGPDLSTLESTSFTLVSLIIGFSFAMALSHFQARREATLREAGAIANATMAAHLLPAAEASAMTGLLAEYTRARTAYNPSGNSLGDLTWIVARTQEIALRLWAASVALEARLPGSQAAGAVGRAVEVLADNRRQVVSALHNQIPPLALAVILCISAVAVTLSGFRAAIIAAGRPAMYGRVQRYAFIGALGLILLLIVDVDHPVGGLVVVVSAETFRAIAGFP